MKQIIPPAALEQHTAVLGKTGSGKTFAAKAAIIEPVLALGRRVGVVDPTDAWWGLRSSRDGKAAGFPVLVLGGDHGDLPLPANGGAAVARLLIEQRVNLVACTKHLTVGERTRWFIDFAGTINRINRSPLHLVLDEAHNFAPQGKVPDPDTGKMLHAANALASEGRSKGIRLTMITQRPQKLHKDTLTCAETLIAMRVLAPHDREAVEDWIKGCGDMAAGKEVLNSLASLQKGEGWVWYPEGGHLERVKFPQIKTFDSSATPTEGHELAAPKGAAEIDLTEIRAAMADAVKEAEANDPPKLRAKIAQLTAELAKKPATKTAADPMEIERARSNGYWLGCESTKLVLQEVLSLAEAHVQGTIGLRDRISAAIKKVDERKKAAPQAPASPAGHVSRASLPGRPPAAPAPRAAKRASGEPISLSSAQQRILDALAWLASINPTEPADRTRLALLADQSPTSSGYSNNLGALRTAGLIDYPYGGVVKLTDAGHAAAKPPDVLPTTEDLHRTLKQRLPAPQWRILEELIKVYPAHAARDDLARFVDQSATSSGYSNNLGALRSLGFIDYPAGGYVVAKRALFLER